MRSEHRLSVLLQVAGLARSSFYYQLNAAKAPDPHAQTKEHIRQVYAQHHGRYGYRRITSALRQAGHTIADKTVRRLMAELGLQSVIRRKKYRSYRGQAGCIAPNRLQRQFHAQAPNQKWVTDVTEFKVQGQKLYLSPIMDLYNGEIVAYETSARPVLNMVDTMLDKAFAKLKPQDKPMVHSDQGWQYQHVQYRHKLAHQGLEQSMSRKGTCLDNAAMESFFGTLKAEFFHLNTFDSIQQLRDGIDQYIHYYNHERIKLKLNGLSPVQYRTQAATNA